VSKSKEAPRGAPFETRELRAGLKAFFQTPYTDPKTGKVTTIGSYRWGVYIFYDYDGEPIYVGQTNEKVSGRIGRHLTNQRTDAVAMSVLDPFEVFEIEVYPLPEYESVNSKHKNFLDAKRHLDAIEYHVHHQAIRQSKFGAILNEKDPPKPLKKYPIPKSIKGQVVSKQVLELRGHPDTRTARRAHIIARLAQTIAERQVQAGLRRTLVTQAERLKWLANERFKQLGGQSAVETAPEASEEETKDD
jgi:hypothetical protein